MEPYNYIINTAQQPNFETGFAQGQAMKLAELQRQAQAAMQADLLQLSLDPSVANISSAMAKYPQIADKFKPLLDSATEQQKQNYRRQTSDIFMMLGNGQREMAMKTLQEHADAARNAGDESAAKSAEVMKNIIESSETGDVGDKYVMSRAGLYLAAAMGPEKFLETYEGLLKMPSTVSEAEAKAQEAQATAAKAATAAKFAESDAALELQKKGWDITKIQNDIQISKQNARIAMMNAQIARESNDLKRQELALKVQDAQMERDEKVRTRVAEASGAIQTVDSTLAVIDDIFADPDSLRAVVGASAWKSMIPGTDNKSMAGKIDQLENMLALENIDKLKGAMSDKDVVFLKGIAANLSRYQDEGKFIKELGRIKGILNKSRSRIAMKYGMPDQQRVVESDF